MATNDPVEAAYKVTMSVLDHARTALSDLLDDTNDPGDRNDIFRDLEDIDDEIQRTTNEFLEYQAGTLALQPPGSEQLEAIEANAAKVANLSARRATAAALLKIATDAATLLSQAVNGGG